MARYPRGWTENDPLRLNEARVLRALHAEAGTDEVAVSLSELQRLSGISHSGSLRQSLAALVGRGAVEVANRGAQGTQVTRYRVALIPEEAVARWGQYEQVAR